MQHVWVRGELQARFWWGNLRERGHLEDQDVDTSIILQDRQYTYNVKLRRVRVTTVAVEKR